MTTQTYQLNGRTYTTTGPVPVGGTKISDSTGTYTQLPSTTPVPTVQSSDMARTAATNAQNTLTNIQNKTANNIAATTTTPAPKTPTVNFNEPKSDTQLRLDAINSSADSEIGSINSIFSNLSSTIDANSNSLIASIKATFARRIDDMKEVNKQTESGVTTAGLVSGRARYAPELQTSILSKTESEGINRIVDLQVQEQQIIAEAQVASDGKKMEALFKQMEMLGKVQEAKIKAIADLNKSVMEMEQLNIQKSQEQRAQIKDDLANQQTIGKNIASSLVASFTGNAEEDNALIEQAAREYGVDPNFINQAISDYKSEQAKNMPSDIREYDELVSRGQYKGTFLGYQRAKAAASKVASSTTGLTQADTNRYDLPVSLVGKSPKAIIEDLSVSRVPAWFKESQVRAGHIQPDAPASEWQSQWDSFRNSGDMSVFKKTIDLDKTSSSSGFILGIPQGGVLNNNAGTDE